MKIKNILSLILLGGVIFLLNSCFYEGSGPFNRIQGEGPIVTEEFDLAKIRGIVVRNSADVVLTQGNNQKIVVEGQRNIIDNLKKDVSNGIWYLGNKENVWRTKPIKVKVRLSELTMVKLAGSGSIRTSGEFDDLDDLEVRMAGSGNIELSVEAEDVIGHIGGSGSISLDGEAREVDFVISGSGSIYASDLKARRGYARISGSGGIHLDAEDELEAIISGSGNIYYEGSPRLDKRISGSGNIRRR